MYDGAFILPVLQTFCLIGDRFIALTGCAGIVLLRQSTRMCPATNVFPRSATNFLHDLGWWIESSLNNVPGTLFLPEGSWGLGAQGFWGAGEEARILLASEVARLISSGRRVDPSFWSASEALG